MYCDGRRCLAVGGSANAKGMVMGKPMTEDAKRRLKEVADAKKGRATLNGLDAMGFAAALDAVQEGRVEFPAEPLRGFRADGGFHGVYLSTLRWTYSREENRADRGRSPRTVFAQTVTHVELKYARDDQHALVRQWLGGQCVPAAKRGWMGPQRGTEYTAVWLYPVQPMLRLIHAVWPCPGDAWTEKVRKYLHGFSAGWVRNMGPHARAKDMNGESDAWREAVADKRHAKAVADLCARGMMYDYQPKP